MSTQGSRLVLASPGMIFDYAGANAPDGFLCGQAHPNVQPTMVLNKIIAT